MGRMTSQSTTLLGCTKGASLTLEDGQRQLIMDMKYRNVTLETKMLMERTPSYLFLEATKLGFLLANSERRSADSDRGSCG